MTLNLQCPIELIPRACASTNYGDGYFTNYPVAFDASEYDNRQLSFEIVAENANAIHDYAVDLCYWNNNMGGSVYCTIVVPKGTTIPTRFRIDGVKVSNRLCIRLAITQYPAELCIYSARLIITQTEADKTTVYIPMVCYDNANAVNPPGAVIDTILNGGWGQPHHEWYNRWRYDSTLYGDGIVDVAFEAAIGKSINSTIGTCFISLFDVTAGVDIAMQSSTYSLTCVYAWVPQWLLVYGHVFEFKIGMVDLPGCWCNLYMAAMRITVRSDLTKAETVWRISKGGQLGSSNWEGSRILLDPTKYPNSRYLLRGKFYRSGAAGSGTVYIRDTGARKGTTGAGGIPDTQLLLTGAEPWTQGIVESDFQPPKVAREFTAETRAIASGWDHPCVLVAIQSPGASLEARDSMLEVPIEFSEGVLNPGNTTTDFTRTKVAIDTSEYDGLVTYFLEISAFHKGLSYLGYTEIDLLNSAGAVMVNAKIYRDGVQRFGFTPTVGLDYYRIKIYGNGGLSTFYIYPRIVISQKQDIDNVVSKTRVYVPMMTASEGVASFLSSDTAAIDNTTATSYTVDQRNTIFLRQDALYDAIAPGLPIRFEAIMSCLYAGSTASVCIYDRTGGAVVAASEMSMSGTSPVYSKVDFAAGAANFIDGHEYEVRLKTSKVGGQTVNLLMARLSIAINPLTKVDVWWRVGFASVLGVASQVYELAYLDLRSYNGRAKYYHESVGKTTNATTQKSRVYEQASGAIDSNGDLAWTESVMTRKRTLLPCNLPSSGYAFVGYTAVVPGGQVGASYIVLQLASVPGHRRPDFWPMFLGDLSGATKRKTLCE